MCNLVAEKIMSYRENETKKWFLKLSNILGKSHCSIVSLIAPEKKTQLYS